MALGIASFDLNSAIDSAIGRAGGNSFLRNTNNANSTINGVNSFLDQLTSGISNPTRFLDRYTQSIANIVGVSPFSSDFGLTSISRVDPVMNFLWCARVVGGNSSAFIDMHEYIDQIQTPGISYNPRTIFRQGRDFKYASEFSMDNLNVTFYSGVDGRSFNYAAQWIRSVQTANGYYKKPSDYKRTVLLDVFDQQNRVVLQFAFMGCWPISWNSYTFNSDSSQVVTTELTLSVDDIRFDLDEVVTSASITSEEMQVDKTETGFAGNSLP